jgi:hypothetical protein
MSTICWPEYGIQVLGWKREETLALRKHAIIADHIYDSAASQPSKAYFKKFWFESEILTFNYRTVFLKWQDSDTGIYRMTIRNPQWPLTIWLNCSTNCPSTLDPRNSRRFFGRFSPSSDNCCPTGRNCMLHTISSSSLKGQFRTWGAKFEALPVNWSWRLQRWGGALVQCHQYFLVSQLDDKGSAKHSIPLRTRRPAAGRLQAAPAAA